jgi:PAS domain S-box-containing protein
LLTFNSGTDAAGLARALEDSEARYRALFEHAPEAIVVFDVSDGRFVDANGEAERLFGASRTELLQHGPADLSPPVQPDGRRSDDAAREWIGRAISGEAPVFEWVHRRLDGVDVTCEVRLLRLPSDDAVLVRGSVIDIRQRRRAEEQAPLLATLAAERDRVVRMQATSAALARAASLDEVTDAVLAEGMRALGARAALVMLVDEAHRALDLVGLYGYRRWMFNDLERISLDSSSPLASAVRLRRRHEFLDLRSWIDHRPGLAVVVRDIGSAGVCVPMIVLDQAVGVLGVAFADADDLTPDTLDDLENLARLAGQAYDRVRLSELDREISHVLQHSLLQRDLPVTADGEVAVRYVSGVAEMEVGGDWYDVIDLADGRLGMAVGDVVGRGVRAATTMGQLRSALRALALVDDDPATVLAHLDRFARHTSGAAMATVVYAVYDPATATVRYACAGHPPPLVASSRSHGGARFLAAGRSIPIGAGLEGEREAGVTSVEPGDLVVLYTDGLVERRGEPIDTGLKRLAALVDEHRDDHVDAVAACLLEELVGDHATDDVALLALRCTARPGAPFLRRFPAEPASLGALRRDLQRWLERAGVRAADASEILLAVGEAAANVVEHAYAEPRRRGDIDVDARRDAPDIVIEIRDHGRWRDAIDDEQRGRGEPLMRALMDDVDRSTGDEGTTVRMCRRGVAAAVMSGRGPRVSPRL